jgi:hypothetical protein
MNDWISRRPEVIVDTYLPSGMNMFGHPVVL